MIQYDIPPEIREFDYIHSIIIVFLSTYAVLRLFLDKTNKQTNKHERNLLHSTNFPSLETP